MSAASKAHVDDGLAVFAAASVSATSRIGWPNVEPRGIGFGEPGDHAQLLVRQLDDAEAERHRAGVAGRRGGDRGPQPKRRRRSTSVDASRRRRRPCTGTSRGAGSGGGRSSASSRRRSVIVPSSSSSNRPSAIARAAISDHALRRRAGRGRASERPSRSREHLARVRAEPRRAGRAPSTGSPTKRGNGACWRIGPITGSSTVTRSPRAVMCGSAKMSAAVYAVATGHVVRDAPLLDLARRRASRSTRRRCR